MKVLEDIRDIESLKENLIDLSVIGIGTGAGLIAATEIGKYVEESVIEPITENSSTADKVLGWLLNNVPKGIAAYLLSQMDMGGSPDDVLSRLQTGLIYGFAGDIALDTYHRIRNQGVPPPSALSLSGKTKSTIQNLTRENAILRSKLEKLSNDGSKTVTVKPTAKPSQTVRLQPNRPLEKKYQFVSDVPGVVAEKQKIHQRYQFVDDSVISPERLSVNYGFIGTE